jgi:uncharacterized protein YgbK (DUF1537 family)
LTVIDTDSRLLAPSDAARVVAQCVSSLDPDQFDLIYKKTDSAFRGPILAEVTALLPLLKRNSALLVPHNPSRGRTVRNGEYRINGTPLHQTSFANDPDHPASCSDVVRLLDAPENASACVETPSQLPSNAIWIGAAAELSDVRAWADHVSSHVLPVGGADFFAANLEAHGLRPSAPLLNHIDAESRLFICGSASAYSRQLIALARQNGIWVCEMPPDVFRGGDVSAWAESIASQLQQSKRTLVVISEALDRTAGASQRLQSSLAEVVSHVLAAHRLDALFLEGGATASAVCRRMGWTDLQVTGELATGVVQMRIVGPRNEMLILKPGSYPWPDIVLTER